MAKRVDVGNVVICDYAGNGENGKFVLANVYSGDILVAGFPARLSLAAYIELTPLKDNDSVEVEISMTVEGTQVMRGSIKMTDTVKGRTGAILIPANMIDFSDACTLAMFIKEDDGRRRTILKKEVLVGSDL